LSGGPFGAGFALSLALIVAIGAQNAFVLRQGLRREHVLPVVVFCALSDALLMGVGVFGMAAALAHRPVLATALTLTGAVFLFVYGVRALWRCRRPATLHPAADGGGMSLAAAMAQVAAFTLLNPHVYLDTVVLVGTVGAQHGGSGRWLFVAGAAAASALWFAALGFGARLLTPWFARPRAWQALDGLIGAVMLALAAMLLARLI